MKANCFAGLLPPAKSRMPPEGKPLSADDIELLKRWLTAGAVWPETDYDREAAHDSRLDHWAWQPMLNVLPPKLPADIEPSVANNIDRFILAKLAEKKLALSPETDRRTLIRRLSFDLHGLPPTPEDVAFFVNDSAPWLWKDWWTACWRRSITANGGQGTGWTLPTMPTRMGLNVINAVTTRGIIVIG